MPKSAPCQLSFRLAWWRDRR